MVRFLVNACVYMVAAAIGILVADMVLDSMSVEYPGPFILAALIFGLIQAIISPLIAQVAERNASMLTGGVGLFSALVALILTGLITSGLSISGIGTWLAAAVVIWLVSMVAGFLLSILVAKRVIHEVRE